jgi:hypothetical protein
MTHLLGGRQLDGSMSLAPTKPADQSANVPDAGWGLLGPVETFDRPSGQHFLREPAVEHTTPGNAASLLMSRAALKIVFVDFTENLGITTTLRFDFV